MSEFWIRKMKRYFRVIDLDGDGVVSKADFDMFGQRYSENENLNPATRERIQKNFDNLWQNYSKLAGPENPLLTELVFIESIKNQRNDAELKVNLLERSRCFVEALGTNEDDFLHEDDHRRLFEGLGIANGAAIAKIAFSAIDTDHDGKVSKEEVDAAFLDFFLSDDEKSPYQFFFGPLE